jgi:hypothetical protein
MDPYELDKLLLGSHCGLVLIIGNEQVKEEIITGNGSTTSDLIINSKLQPHSM